MRPSSSESRSPASTFSRTGFRIGDEVRSIFLSVGPQAERLTIVFLRNYFLVTVTGGMIVVFLGLLPKLARNAEIPKVSANSVIVISRERRLNRGRTHGRNPRSVSACSLCRL